MNENYIKLTRFPKDFCGNIISEQWKAQRTELLNFLYSCEHGLIDIHTSELKTNYFTRARKYDEKLYHISIKKHKMNYNIEYDGYISTSFFISLPGKIDSFHIDTERSCAINFPVEVNNETSAFRIGKNSDLASYEFRSSKIKDWQHKFYDGKGKGTFNLTDNEFESYGLEEAVLFNSKIPHGGANFGDDIRVIGSIGFNKPYSEVIEHFKDWM